MGSTSTWNRRWMRAHQSTSLWQTWSARRRRRSTERSQVLRWKKCFSFFFLYQRRFIKGSLDISTGLSPFDFQVSFDVAWSPNCIDKRCYDYVGIAKHSDLLFVMSYDEQSQITGDCIAMANAPLNQTLKGLLSSFFFTVWTNQIVIN